jgi:5-methylcytosine-specific restriction endonuclease McrA
MSIGSSYTLAFESVTADMGVAAGAVHGAVWRYIDLSDGLCKVSMDTLAQCLHLSRATVVRYLHALVSAGYLEDTTPDTNGAPHAYRPTDYDEYVDTLRHYVQTVERPKATAGGRASHKHKIPDHIRWSVWERDNFTCKHCGSRRNLSVDHVVPESMGGTLTMENLQTLCKTCNCRKGAR